MSWKWVKLGKILTESKVESLNPSAENRIRVKLNAAGVEKRPLIAEAEGATKYFVRKAGQFIYGKQNLHKGAFGIIPVELDGFESSSDLPAFDIDKSCKPEWLNYYLKQGNYYQSLVEIAKGAATKRIQPEKLYQVEIPLPEPEEQERILDSITQAENNSLPLFIEIDYQKTLLNQLKKAILQEAIEGKLTTDWRAANPSVEPASKLLQRIKAEKDKLIKEKKIKKEKPLPPITEAEIPFKLPEGWDWCRLGDISLYGSSEKAEPHRITKDTWVLDLEDIEKESSIIKERKTFSERDSLSTKSIFKKGWVLYSKLRPYLDKVVVADGDGVCTTEIIPLPIYSNLNPYFLMLGLKGRHFLKYVNSKVGGMKMPRLGTEDGRLALIPVAPVEEQIAIVERVQALTERCRLIDAETNKSDQYAKMLMQSVMMEAFDPSSKAFIEVKLELEETTEVLV